jgi:excisionase family DNA binding protein
MPDSSLLTVNEAAEHLGVSQAAIRQQIASGTLPALKRGRSWWLDARVVNRRARQTASPSRPLSPTMAWAVVLLASGDAERAKDLVAHARYLSRTRAWLKAHPLHESASRLRLRGESEELAGHPSELKRLLERPDMLATGASADDLIGLLGTDPGVEAYAPAGHRKAILAEHALTAAAGGPMRIRWVNDEIWPHLDQEGERRAPRTAILLDLLESENPRARREAARALEQ